MSKPNLFTVGGAVQAGGGLYIHRQADNDLLKLCREGAFAYVLTSRQVGKSSLMVRAAEQLAEENIRSVIVDLTVFGVQVTAEAWYLGLLTAISDRLGLSTDVIDWWRSREQFSFTQRLTQFFHEVLLAEVKARVVIFIDEIDSTLSLPASNGAPFTDDFYAAIRYLYNARATMPDFKRLSFVLIGVATPGDLIRDPKRTPFNIGQRVDITDFTHNEALPLAEGLEIPPEQARQVLRWVIKWTGGHPYLTQRLCRAIADQHRTSAWTEDEVDRTVANTFFGKMSEHDNNLQFVRDMLTKRAPESALAVLATYKEIRLGRQAVRDEEQSPIKSHLKLSGVVKREDAKLTVRNPIYQEVFDKRWIQEHWPVGWWETIPKAVKIAAGFVVFLFLTSIVLLAMYVGKLREVAAGQEQIAREKDRRIVLTDSLYNVATQALADAQTQRQKADSAKSRSDSLAIEKDKASADAKEQQKLAEQQTVLAQKNAEESKKNEATANLAKQQAQTNLAEVERRRRIEIARTLAIQAPLQQPGDAELAILLARQAFLLNQAYQGPWNRLIYDALLKTLGGAAAPQALRGHLATVRSVAFNPTGEIFASASDDKTVRLWHRQQNFANPRLLNGHRQNVRALAFSPDGQILASASDDYTVCLWNVNVRDPNAGVRILPGHRGGVWAVAFSPDGNLLASGGADGAVMLWNVKKEKAEVVVTRQHKSRVRALIFSANGQWLGAGGDDGTIQFWPIGNQNGQNGIEIKHKNGIRALAFNSRLGLLAAGDTDGKVLLWQWSTGEPPKAPKEFVAHEAGVNSLAFSPDGKRVATASADKRVKIWEINQTNEAALVFEHNDYVWSAAFSPDGNTMASGSADNLVQFWVTRTEILAQKACAVVKRNLSEDEWRAFIGADINYEKTCDHLPEGKNNFIKGGKDDDK